MEKINPTVSELQDIVDRWIRSTGNGYFSPLTNTAILAEETGEGARVMARIYGEQRPKPGDDTSHLGDELMDVIWVAVALANQCGIDLTEALAANLAKKESRDAARFKSIGNVS